jgi:16S rRNA (cytidine1402-2'-O)-methyltransferase
MSENDRTPVDRGALYVVATPIGNLADMSQRAVDVLAHVDRIAAEDTRRSGRLLQHFSITTPMLALHEHNERELAPRLVEQLQQGESLAVISDAGTPLISDPGYNLVRLAHEAGVSVVPIPGASALICALSASGLPTDRFVFEGFLPAKAVSRRARLEALRSETRTLIFYESSHRLVECLHDMQVVFGVDRYVVLARELTKQFETLHGDGVRSLLHWVQDDPNQQKGEMVLLVQGEAEAEGHEINVEAERVLLALLDELPIKTAAKLTARITGLNKRALYDRALQLKEG